MRRKSARRVLKSRRSSTGGVARLLTSLLTSSRRTNRAALKYVCAFLLALSTACECVCVRLHLSFFRGRRRKSGENFLSAEEKVKVGDEHKGEYIMCRYQPPSAPTSSEDGKQKWQETLVHAFFTYTHSHGYIRSDTEKDFSFRFSSFAFFFSLASR